MSILVYIEQRDGKVRPVAREPFLARTKMPDNHRQRHEQP